MATPSQANRSKLQREDKLPGMGRSTASSAGYGVFLVPTRTSRHHRSCGGYCNVGLACLDLCRIRRIIPLQPRRSENCKRSCNDLSRLPCTLPIQYHHLRHHPQAVSIIVFFPSKITKTWPSGARVPAVHGRDACQGTGFRSQGDIGDTKSHERSSQSLG